MLTSVLLVIAVAAAAPSYPYGYGFPAGELLPQDTSFAQPNLNYLQPVAYFGDSGGYNPGYAPLNYPMQEQVYEDPNNAAVATRNFNPDDIKKVLEQVIQLLKS